jgi:uncharacterized protein (TIGR01777 family)
MTATVVISGSSGLIGQALARHLEGEGNLVRRLVRRPPRNANEFAWNPGAGEIDARAFDGATAVVNLAGENIGHRWTAARRARIRSSRIDGTTLIASTILKAAAPPSVFVSGSAIGFYGDRGDELLDESSTHGGGVLPSLCRDWEAAAQVAGDRGTRVAFVRTGIVLARHGGALARMLLPFRLGVGGRLGHGRQWMSWITLGDHVRALTHLLSASEISGAVNLCAPGPVTNREFTAALGNVLHRPTIVPVPAFALRLFFGEMADETLLVSQRAMPTVLAENGFTFTSPRIDVALRAVLSATTP